jgi:hypothetical protein
MSLYLAVCGSIATFGPGCIVEASRGSTVTLCESFFCAANGICRPIPEKQKWEWPETLMCFHDLRYSTATILLRMGVPANVI